MDEQIIIATSKSNKCINRLWFILKQSYPQFEFEEKQNNCSVIYAKVNKTTDINIIEAIKIFCDGYTCGYEDALS